MVLVTLVLWFAASFAFANGKSESSASTGNKSTNNPNDAKAKYEEGYTLMYAYKHYDKAVSAWEEALEIDPGYRVKAEFHLTPQNAAGSGVIIKENLKFSNFSLFLLLGYAYGYVADDTRWSDRYRYSAMEKSLASSRKGYEIDITGRKNNNTNLKIAYLIHIVSRLNAFYKQDEAAEVYAELAKIANVTERTAQTAKTNLITTMYEQANASLDSGDYTAAINQYRNVLKEAPDHTAAKTNLKTAWDKYTAENPKLYPAPFEGSWEYFQAATQRYETFADSYTRTSQWTEYVGNTSRVVTRTEKIPTTGVRNVGEPEMREMLTFSGINYSVIRNGKTTRTGTFFYNGNTIELDNGTVLRYRGIDIKQGDTIFKRLPGTRPPSSANAGNPLIIEDLAFQGKGLTSVTIPDGVTSIGNAAFYGNRLTSVTIPGSVTSIGRSAFRDNRLTSVTITNGVTSIGDRAFAGNQLTSVTIGNSVTTIGRSAFSNNYLTSVTIPNSVTSISQFAFDHNLLTSVTIGANVFMEEFAFENNFRTNYRMNGRKAGTYTFVGYVGSGFNRSGSWRLQ
jgi:tetratricopeptide (TPR) repeat protein